MILFLLPWLMAVDSSDQCFRLYYGHDLTAARACFEKSQRPCNGSSPDLSRFYLGAMYLDGQGGAANQTAAKELFNGCFEDIGVQALLNRKQPSAGKLDFCRDVGGSTLTSKECNALTAGMRNGDLDRVSKQIRSGLSRTEASLFDAARKAFDAFVKADGVRVADDYRGGTLAGVSEGQSEIGHTTARTKRLQALATYNPGPPRDADTALNTGYRQVLNASDGKHRQILIEAERAWIAYRDAEAAFYEQHFGSKYGGAVVRADVNAALAAERTKDLKGG